MSTEDLRELRTDIVERTRGPHTDLLDQVSASGLRMMFNDIAPPDMHIGPEDEGAAGQEVSA